MADNETRRHNLGETLAAIEEAEALRRERMEVLTADVTHVFLVEVGNKQEAEGIQVVGVRRTLDEAKALAVAESDGWEMSDWEEEGLLSEESWVAATWWSHLVADEHQEFCITKMDLP